MARLCLSAAARRQPRLPVAASQRQPASRAATEAAPPPTGHAPVSMGMAKPMPEEAPLSVGSAIAVLMPIRRPLLSRRGPPAGAGGRQQRERETGQQVRAEQPGRRKPTSRQPTAAAGWPVRCRPARSKRGSQPASLPAGPQHAKQHAAAPAVTRVPGIDACITLNDISQGSTSRGQLPVEPADDACFVGVGEARERVGRRSQPAQAASASQPRPKHPPAVSVWSSPNGFPAGRASSGGSAAGEHRSGSGSAGQAAARQEGRQASAL